MPEDTFINRRQYDPAVARLEISFDYLKEEVQTVKESVTKVDTKLDALLEITTTLARLSDKQLTLEIADGTLKEEIQATNQKLSAFAEKVEPVMSEFSIFKTKWETTIKVMIFVVAFLQGVGAWYIKGKIDDIEMIKQQYQSQQYYESKIGAK